jgi:hypothetical protein
MHSSVSEPETKKKLSKKEKKANKKKDKQGDSGAVVLEPAVLEYLSESGFKKSVKAFKKEAADALVGFYLSVFVSMMEI